MVGGTVESHKKPKVIPNNTAIIGLGGENINTLADAVKAIESCTKAERSYLRLWLNGEIDQIFEEVKEMKTNE